MCDQQSLRSAFASRLNISMTAKILNEHHLEFLSLKGGCTGLSESIFVKMPHCWKSHVKAHILPDIYCNIYIIFTSNIKGLMLSGLSAKI